MGSKGNTEDLKSERIFPIGVLNFTRKYEKGL